MPDIPVSTALGFVGLLLLALGVFLFVAGFNIVKIEKISVQGGKRTWIFGAVCILVGIVLLVTNESVRSKPQPTPTVEIAAQSDSDAAPAAPTAVKADMDKMYDKLYQAKTWELVLQDSFEDNRANWTMWNVDDEYKWESMQVDGGVLNWGLAIKQPDQFFVEISPLYSYADFYYAVKARRAGDSPSGNQAAWGILFRRAGANYYTFRINDAQEFALQIHSTTGWKDLNGWTKTPFIEIDKFNELSVVAEGADLYAFINGAPIGMFHDETYAAGNIGLLAGLNFVESDPTIFEFDDFELRQKAAD